jgi:hypothetical protein
MRRAEIRTLKWIIGGCAVFFALAISDFFVCPVKHFLHIPCPGCGLTRGFIAILHFRFYDALRYNFLSIPLFMMLGSATLCALSDAILKTNLFDKFRNYEFSAFQIVNLVTIFILNWSMNILRGI